MYFHFLDFFSHQPISNVSASHNLFFKLYGKMEYLLCHQNQFSLKVESLKSI